jgi:hypothetical protein
MREEGSIRYVDLEPFDGVRVQVFKTEGIEDRKIVLCSQEGELAWGGLEYFGADVVGEFAFQLHKQLQAASQLRMISSMDIIELVAWFAQGGEPTQPLRFCHATEQGLQGGQTLEVSSDGRASASRWDPVAGQAIPISQATLPVDKVRELARVWVALAPSFPHLPPFVPSSAGTLVFSVRHAEQRVELQLSGEAYDHATTRALRDAFGAIGQLLSS